MLRPFRLSFRYFSAGLLLLAATPSSHAAAIYEWGFSSGNFSPDLGNGTMATSGATVGAFGTTNGTSVPNINGAAATYLNVPVSAAQADGYSLTLTSSPANGGGSYINQYTFAFDLFVPTPAGYVALLNTAPDNSNDADFYIDPNGGIGIAALGGYSPAGSFAFGTWQRLVISVDLATGDARYFVNGTKVFDRDGAAMVDSRFALYSNQNAGVDVRLFNENDTSGNYTHALYLSSVAFADRSYSDSEVAALGGPKAAGILVPEPGTAVLLLAAAGILAGQRRRPSSTEAAL